MSKGKFVGLFEGCPILQGLQRSTDFCSLCQLGMLLRVQLAGLSACFQRLNLLQLLLQVPDLHKHAKADDNPANNRQKVCI